MIYCMFVIGAMAVAMPPLSETCVCCDLPCILLPQLKADEKVANERLFKKKKWEEGRKFILGHEDVVLWRLMRQP